VEAASISVGRLLREARLQHGLELSDVAARTGVATKYLRALEWERPDLLPPGEQGPYARVYAECLDLDGSLLPAAAAVPPLASTGAGAAAAAGSRGKALGRVLLPYLVVLGPALAVIAVVLLFDGGWGPSRVARPAAPKAAPRPAQRPAPIAVPPATPAVTLPPAAVPEQGAAAAPVSPTPARASTRLVLTAAGGDSWLQVRAGSARGEVLYDGMLRRGQSFRVERRRLWLRLGAASNVRLAVNGSRLAVPVYGTLDAVVGPDGFRQVPLAD
jgi:hypothetical protein